jgi:excisionase family DNA binding protein
MRKTECTVREAARRLGVRLDVVYASLWAGKLAARKYRGKWFIPLAAVEARRQSRNAQVEAVKR